MNRYRRFALVVCLALTLSACGGGDKKATSAPTPTPTPTPTPVTAAQAKTIAAAGVLLPADLPGYTGAAQEADPSDAKDQATFDTCLGVPVTTFLAQDLGQSFTKDGVEFDSSASVVTTAAMAKAEIDAADSAKGTACLKALALAGAGAELTNPEVTVTTQSVTVPGADNVLFFDFILTGTGGGQKFEVRGSQVVALVGQTQIELDSYATAPPLPTKDEVVALMTKAVARVKAAS